MLVALPEIEIDDLHRGPCGFAATDNQFLRSFQVSPQHQFGVRDDDSETAVRTKNAMYLTRDPLSILKGKVLHHMFTENSIERLVGKGEWPSKVEQVVNVSIAKSIYIHPVNIIEAARARAQVQK